jgi:DUF3035 family protein
MRRWSFRTLRTPLRLAPALCALAGLSGCGAFEQSAPDEFAVTTRSPLVIPNDFSLPPPRPGIERPQEQPPRLQAAATLVPEFALTGGSGADSPGQQALLKTAGPPAPRGIRARVDREAAKDTGGGLGSALLFWQSARPPGVVIDPVKEAARLRARGVSTSPGSAVPTVPPATSTSLPEPRS